ncbi:MAG: NACHT domain-containing protein [Thiogranum sp.]
MLLGEIRDKWENCRSAPQRQRLWRELTRPEGIWLRACQEAVAACREQPATGRAAFLHWLDHDATGSAVRYCEYNYSRRLQSAILRAFFQLGLRVCERGGSLPDREIPALAKTAGVPAGFLCDIGRYLCKQAMRKAGRSVELTALLVNRDDDGVPARLTLELVRNGEGTVYPAPELSLCRDRAFLASENTVTELFSGQLNGADIRWSLQRLDGKPLGHLTGPSMGAAFALGLRWLLDQPEDGESVDLRRMGISACVKNDGELQTVSRLWDKLDPDAVELADLNIIVVASGQGNVPPKYQGELSPLLVIAADNVHHAVTQLLSHSQHRRGIRRYEGIDCRSLEFRLSGTQAHIDSHYQMLPLLRAAGDGHSGDGVASGLPDISELQRWEDEARGRKRCYEAVDLDDVLEETGQPARLLLLGSPGSGKTTLIVYLAWLASTRRLFSRLLVPARLRLRAWEQWDKAHPESGLFDYLAAHYDRLVENAPTARHWRNWLRQGEVLLLLDGLDEVNDKQWFLDKQAELRGYANMPVVITCRTVNLAPYRNHLTDFSRYWLGPLSTRQRNQYIRQYPAQHDFDREALIRTLDDIDALKTLSPNPLILSIICFSVDDTGEEDPPRSRTGLYKRLVDRMLNRPARVDVHYPAEPPPADDKLAILSHAALILFARHRLNFTGNELTGAMLEALEHRGYGRSAPWANALLKDFTENSGLLRGHKPSSEFQHRPYFFIHLTIHEYLCALALRDPGITGEPAFIERYVAKEKRWEEVFAVLNEMKI